MIQNDSIDGGKAFDWGKTSMDYAKYRDIYPDEFYQYLVDGGIVARNRQILDIGTGTGVLPRNLYKYGAHFTGADISKNQIAQARRLAKESGMDIKFICSPAEDMKFPEKSFDAVTACQCFTYFNHDILAPKIHRILKPSGTFVLLYMAWLPHEDGIAGQSEDLVRKYNPAWTGGGETRHDIWIPEIYHKYFDVERQAIFDLRVPFDRESWNGRMRACRGIGASLPEAEVLRFEQEHRALLTRIAPESFEVLHYGAMAILRKKQLVYTFEAEILQNGDMDAAYIIFPYDVKKEFDQGRVRVHAMFDDIPYDGSIVRMGKPDYIIGITKEIRKKLGKSFGDTIKVQITERM